MAHPLNSKSELNPYYAKVIGYVDSAGQLIEAPLEGGAFKLLINAGEEHGASVGTRVLVFTLGPEVKDPETGDSLGCFEVVRGEGRVESVQVRMSVIKSTRTVTKERRKPQNPLSSVLGGPAGDLEFFEAAAPFIKPEIGDFVRLI